jgi:hypothetical protein
MKTLKQILLETSTPKVFIGKGNDPWKYFKDESGEWWGSKKDDSIDWKMLKLSLSPEKYTQAANTLNKLFPDASKAVGNQSNELIRMPNGFLIDKVTLEQIKTKFKMGDWITSPTFKQLTYDKPLKIRNGIQNNEWRGFNDVSSDWISSNGDIQPGIGSRNVSEFKQINVHIGSIITDKIKGGKIYVANNWKNSVNKQPLIYSYFYIVSNNKFESGVPKYWVPSTWVEL